jgi:hypothetical protein
MLLVVVLGTSAVAAALAIYRHGWSMAGLGRGILTAVETVGAVAIFFAINVAIGIVLVLGGRVLTPFYLSLYEMADVALLVLSTLQALVYQGWRVARVTSR